MANDTTKQSLTDAGRRVLGIEARAIEAMSPRIGDDFATACRLCLATLGRVIVTGMGKSGHIGGKIAATLASTGTPAFFVHPGEAGHGDLGMITPKDAVIAISNSGETAEIIMILPLLKRLDLPLITMTGEPESTLGKASAALLDTSVHEEACPLNLAPTASTTTALAMGDALAVALLESRGFTAEDFARSHPGGALGRRLLLKVEDLMHTGDEIPQVEATTSLADGLIEMSRKGLGMTAIVTADGQLTGIFTDGDLRRTLDQPINIYTTTMADVMTRNCKTAKPEQLAAESVRILETQKITALLVVDDQNQLVGALNVHDLLRAGVM
ncbi:MAG: KpsF/GutQ family sugar-phosphate isomerase [Gammaproteobacteria bacterium]|jgi:arabinose-5-phosphate isomerase|nr:D-arabinose 5-phosphate isomerase [Chromatiales bacterium]MCP4926873.1 KpsF/GutQ family sugar-phosphate isomerase [Gammaproteobacteria bacterium]MDP7154385.1 KpsF/GutQ family sugar-phosphate isomerase [Gammaproteobacteria bacterium]MDP7295892.1 KpsF/GutQ family sugar-phosphate isomerase [Gammaproteobacteria bacterium]MDP7419865.1 KpsF/GutQ family sugar-phosphate isomerase [Gammaproteobacteria bacterium]